jgi:O-antigen ligase
MLVRVLDVRTLLQFGLLLAAAVWSLILISRVQERPGVLRRGGKSVEVAVFYVIGLGTLLAQGLAPRQAVDSGSGFADVALAAAPQTGAAAAVAPLVDLAVFGLCGLIIVRSLGTGEETRPRGLLVGALLFGASGVTAAIFGAVPVATRAVLLFPLVALAVWRSRLSTETVQHHLRILTGVFVWGSLILAVVAPQRAFFAGQGRSFFGGLQQLSGFTFHPNYLGFVAAFGLVLAVAGWRHRFSRLHTMACVLTLLLTQSRTSYLAAVLAVVVLLTSRQQKGQALKALGVAAWAGLVVAATILIVNIGLQTSILAALTTSDITTLNGRDRIWGAALDAFKQNPQFGYGWTVFSPEYRNNILGAGFATAGQAHNQFLQTLAERGAVGAATLITYLLLMVRAARRARAEVSPLNWAALAVLLPGLLTEAPLQATYMANTGVVVHVGVLALLFGGLQATKRTAGEAGQAEQVLRRPSDVINPKVDVRGV